MACNSRERGGPIDGRKAGQNAEPQELQACVIGRHDRLLPLEFQRGVVRYRLGIVSDEIDAGHLPALSRPDDLTRLLVGYQAEAQGKGRRR